MIVGTLTIVALVVSSIVILVTLGKISRQLDNITTMFKVIDKKLAAGNLTSTTIQEKIDWIEKDIKATKGDIDWKG